MIVSRRHDALRLVTQSDHAHLAGEMLSLFRLAELVDHPRRGRLLRAVREHDNGWREVDAAPPVDRRSGRPHDYRSLPDEIRRELWDRGARRFVGEDTYVALLVVRHARHLHDERRAETAWVPWLAALEDLDAELLEECGLAAEEVAADYRWLAIADRLSLALCEAADDRFDIGPFGVVVEGDTLRLEPFPLAGRTTFRLSCRHLPDRRYDGDRDLGSALARARWERVELRLGPLRAG